MRGLLSWVDFGIGSMCSSVSASPCMYYYVDISLPSSVSLVGAVMVSVVYAIVVAFAAFRCMAASCSWHFLFSSFMMHSLVSFFHCYAVIFSSSSKSETRHSGDHATITLKISSSIAMNGSFTHVRARSLCAQIYRLSIYALNVFVLFKMLYMVGDKCGLWLIHVHKLTSMNTKNNFIL